MRWKITLNIQICRACFRVKKDDPVNAGIDLTAFFFIYTRVYRESPRKPAHKRLSYSAPSGRFRFRNIYKTDYLSLISLLSVRAESKCVCSHVNTNGLQYECRKKIIIFYKTFSAWMLGTGTTWCSWLVNITEIYF